MIPILTETIYLLSQIPSFARLYFQYHESKKEKRSVNPQLYWILTIASSLLLIVYGYLIGSIIMPISGAGTIIYSIWHIKLNKENKTR